MIFVFGKCEIDCDRRELRREGSVIHVEPQVFDVLVHLVRHRDRVVSKEDLIRAVWDGRSVSDDMVTSRVSAARRAIGDIGAEQRLIRTMTRRGFRFVGEVREEPNASPTGTAAQPSTLDLWAVQQSVRFCQASDGVHLLGGFADESVRAEEDDDQIPGVIR
jgi:DNA-binding winged helix-turn-helix (wHTH) protein